MPSIISTIGYITEANTITSASTIVTKGILACNRPGHNDPLFINFIAFNNPEEKKSNYEESSNKVINRHLVYLLHRKFVYNKSIGESYELQVKICQFIHFIN